MKQPHLIQELTTSDGWAEFKKQLTVRRDASLLQLANLGRPKEVPDDVLRGYVEALNWVLKFEERASRAIAELAAEKSAGPVAEPDAAGSPMLAEPITE